MKALLSFFLLIQLTFAPGGWAVEERYDCSMTGQRDLRMCCCSVGDAAASVCCAAGSCGSRVADESSGEPSLAASGCCRVHWEVTPQAGDTDLAAVVPGAQVIPSIAPVDLPGESNAIPRPALWKEPHPLGVRPGFPPAVPLRLRHCSLLI